MGGDLKFIWDVGGRLRAFSRRDAGGHNVMITRRRDVAEKQVWDAGGEGKNVWDVGMPIIKTMGGGRQVKKVKKVKNSSGRREAGGRVKMALGGGMQDKNEAGGGMLYPCVPPTLPRAALLSLPSPNAST